MDAHVRKSVVRRAKGRCEYCRIPQAAIPYHTFHIEHIIAKQHGGTDEPDNLCLACHRCNAYKGTNLAAIDPDTGQVVDLFHPRRQDWRDHFELRRAHVIGRTPTGRATVRLLDMNDYRRLALREELITRGKLAGE